jgi:hypothetical protein
LRWSSGWWNHLCYRGLSRLVWSWIESHSDEAFSVFVRRYSNQRT